MGNQSYSFINLSPGFSLLLIDALKDVRAKTKIQARIRRQKVVIRAISSHSVSFFRNANIWKVYLKNHCKAIIIFFVEETKPYSKMI